MSGLFDIKELNPEPPDPLEFDLDLLSTLSTKRISTDSNDSNDTTQSETNLALDNWQMNEVFQDIPSPLDDVEEHQQTSDSFHLDYDLDALMKHAFEDIETTEASVEKKEIAATTQEPVSIVQDDTILPTGVNLQWVVQETFGSEAALDGFSLLEELEAMDVVQTADSPSSENSSNTNTEATTAVEVDHQYTQLCNVVVKPHETKKQAIRRVKNNAASKVCRKQRKNRFATNAAAMEELAKKNKELQENIASVQSVVDLLKEHLVSVTRVNK